ncbi:uncharacterized protein BJ171DRAFT_579603 [Polychytrium aggregatum]|uniref:uncharacterized protein n=1 Tax=Polychytrium aggregatum TaxID=110093 RepID=UPI0022FEF5C7|nr:uncharacterized protein BJ171DRAFT_579603 [Polychytrium aggregatum]KAI9206625.1 hypothetical protein BJ171DRAFT_579603 [Polychytrium aggregatum]
MVEHALRLQQPAAVSWLAALDNLSVPDLDGAALVKWAAKYRPALASLLLVDHHHHHHHHVPLSPTPACRDAHRPRASSDVSGELDGQIIAAALFESLASADELPLQIQSSSPSLDTLKARLHRLAHPSKTKSHHPNSHNHNHNYHLHNYHLHHSGHSSHASPKYPLRPSRARRLSFSKRLTRFHRRRLSQPHVDVQPDSQQSPSVRPSPVEPGSSACQLTQSSGCSDSQPARLHSDDASLPPRSHRSSTRLPPELWHRVFQFVYQQSQDRESIQATLAMLCQVSRLFYQTATRFLWHNPILQSNELLNAFLGICRSGSLAHVSPSNHPARFVRILDLSAQFLSSPVSSPDLILLAQHIPRLNRLKLDIRVMEMDTLEAVFAACPAITHLEIGYFQDDAAKVGSEPIRGSIRGARKAYPALAEGLGRLANLFIFDIDYDSSLSFWETLQASQPRRLRRVVISDCGLPEGYLGDLLASIDRLKHLGLWYCDIGQSTLLKIPSYCGKSLEHLDLFGTHELDDATLAAMLRQLGSLKQLDIRSTHVSAKVTIDAVLSSCPQLHTLCLPPCNESTRPVRGSLLRLIKERNTRLKALFLSGEIVSDLVLKYLAEYATGLEQIGLATKKFQSLLHDDDAFSPLVSDSEIDNQSAPDPAPLLAEQQQLPQTALLAKAAAPGSGDDSPAETDEERQLADRLTAEWVAKMKGSCRQLRAVSLPRQFKSVGGSFSSFDIFPLL